MYRIKWKKLFLILYMHRIVFALFSLDHKTYGWIHMHITCISYFLPPVSNTIYTHMGYEILIVFKEMESDVWIVFIPESPFWYKAHPGSLWLLCDFEEAGPCFLEDVYEVLIFLWSNTTTRDRSISIESKIQWKLLIHIYK
jgi:hypothetical protein